ncbi:PEGA domain-containing protein [Candidatus Wolfebacteria bacterium]|nr:PEGA domain-containing protein [Candidatus Wolfebacteria bacterium]
MGVMDGFQNHFTYNRATYILVAILALLLLAWGVWYAVLLYTAGTGTIEIQDVPAGTRITLDGKTIEEVSLGMSTIHTDVRPGEHTVNATAPSLWPWTKTITVPENITVRISPFLLRERPQVLRVDAGTNESAKAQQAFGVLQHLETPDSVNSDDGTVTAWIENDTVYAEWKGVTSATPEYFCTPDCKPTLTVLSATQPVTNVHFLGTRNDVLLFTTPEGIYALELDPRGTQNFQPVYQEAGADFRIRDNESLYVYSNSDYFVLEL